MAMEWGEEHSLEARNTRCGQNSWIYRTAICKKGEREDCKQSTASSMVNVYIKITCESIWFLRLLLLLLLHLLLLLLLLFFRRVKQELKTGCSGRDEHKNTGQVLSTHRTTGSRKIHKTLTLLKTSCRDPDERPLP